MSAYMRILFLIACSILAIVKITWADAYMHIYCYCMNLRMSAYLHVYMIIYTGMVHSSGLYT